MIRRGWVVAGALALAVAGSPATARAASTCELGPGGQVKHVIVLQFDNTHLARDAGGVPSDLEQMPALKGFLEDNGTLLSNDHTVLISHTAGGIVSTETGLYPDRNGLTVSNSYEFFGLSRHRCGQCHGEVAVAGWCGRRSVIGPQVSMTRARAALAVWKP